MHLAKKLTNFALRESTYMCVLEDLDLRMKHTLNDVP